MPWVRPEANERPADYARRMVSAGLLPFEVIKGLREGFGLDLAAASSLVVTAQEIEIFLDAQARRGVSPDGVKRLLTTVYGLTRADAATVVSRGARFTEGGDGE